MGADSVSRDHSYEINTTRSTCHEIIDCIALKSYTIYDEINSNFYVLLHGQEHHGANTKKFNNVLCHQIFTF